MTQDEISTAKHIVDLEKDALNLWFNGQTAGYNRLWSRESFPYFDVAVMKRVDSHAAIEEVLKTIEGKLFAPSY
ncbi:MAG: hypothetical protein NC098_05580 [Lachnoclostridium sp.]|nr:hypothetical protein [Lachnoclostridium sp.]